MKLLSIISIRTVVPTLCCSTGYNMNCHPHTHLFSTIFCLPSFCVFFLYLPLTSRHFPVPRPQILHNISEASPLLFKDYGALCYLIANIRFRCSDEIMPCSVVCLHWTEQIDALLICKLSIKSLSSYDSPSPKLLQ